MYNAYYNPAAMGTQPNMPVVNNFPIAGQPVNMTQSAVNFDTIKQLLVNRIMGNAQSDVAAAELARQCAGINNSWFTEKLNSLVQTTATTIDVMYRTNRMGKSMDQIVQDAVEEVYCCSWAMMTRHHPNLMQDATMQQPSRMALIKQWLGVAEQRSAMLQQLGLLQNNPIANMQPWQTPAYNNGGMPSMGMGVPHASMMGNHTVTTFNNPSATMSNNPFASMGVSTNPAQTAFGGVNNNPYAIPSLSNSVANTNSFNGFKLTQSNNQFDSASMQPTLSYNGNAQNRIREISERNRRLREQGMYNENAPINPSKQQEVVNQNHLVAPTDINQVPARQGLLPKQPHEVKTRLEEQAVSFTQPSLQPNTVNQPTNSWQDTVRKLTAESTNNNGITEFNVQDIDKVAKVFEGIQKEEVAKDGLLEDEVRYLNKREMYRMYEDGVKLEQPNPMPLGVNPFFSHHFIVLTKHNTIRQYVVPLGEGMRPEAHDAVAHLRNDPFIANSPNAGKIIPSTLNFNHSTIGGVIFDRFKLTKAKLREELDIAKQEEDIEKRKVLFERAYENFGNNVEEDLKRDISELIMQNDDDAEFEAKFFSDEELAKRREQEERFLHSEEDKDVTYIEGIHDISNAVLLSNAEEDTPVESNVVNIKMYKTERILKGYNKPSDKKRDAKTLESFYWKDDINPDEREVELEIDADKLALILKTNKDKLPADLWSRLNRRATQVTNEGIKYILGLPKVTIESFAEDYLDLLPWLQKNLDINTYKNAEMAVNYLDGYIVQQMRTLHKFDNIIIHEDDVDVSDLRLLGEVKHHLVAECPMLPETLGLEGESITLTKEASHGLFPIFATMLEKQIASRSSRRYYNHSVTNVYVVFNDGSLFKVLPTLGVQPKFNETDKEFYKLITLVRVDTE